MRTRKYFTVEEWHKFKTNDYFDMQEMLCQKYDVILTDYKTKREKIFSVLKKINLKNFDKGIAEFSKLVQLFGGSMDQLTREIDSPKRKCSHYKKTTSRSKNDDNLNSLWGESYNSVPIWSDNDSDNLEKIWGQRND